MPARTGAASKVIRRASLASCRRDGKARHEKPRQTRLVEDQRDVGTGQIRRDDGDVIVDPINQTGGHAVEESLARVTGGEKAEGKGDRPRRLRLHGRHVASEPAQHGFCPSKTLRSRTNRSAKLESNAGVHCPASAQAVAPLDQHALLRMTIRELGNIGDGGCGQHKGGSFFSIGVGQTSHSGNQG